MKHDDIVLELTKEKLTSLLCHKFGEKGVWSEFHWVVQKEIDQWSPSGVYNLLIATGMIQMNNSFSNTVFKDLNDIKEKFTAAQSKIRELTIENSLDLEKTFEFPIVKGENQYKCTKGFIDLIVHCRPQKLHLFSSYNKCEPIEFVIEIKKESDFDDFGSILRQIKEYKEYYDGYGVKKWCSRIIGEEDRNYGKRVYCILSTKIPDKIKRLFSEEGIICLELNVVKNKQEVL